MCLLLLSLIYFQSHAAKLFLSNSPEFNKYFTGRQKDIKAIHRFLNKNRLGTFVIAGFPGIGKTQIVKEYLNLYSKNYSIVLWLDAGSGLVAQAKGILKELNRVSNVDKDISVDSLSDNDIALTWCEKLARIKKDWIIVFDNAQDKSSIAKFIPTRRNYGVGHVLVTTKNKIDWRDALIVENFNRYESIEFLYKVLRDNDRQGLDKLASILGDYPLAMAQAASYIKATHSMTVDKYIDLYIKERDRIWQYEAKWLARAENLALDNYHNTVSTALRINIQEVKDKNEKAFELLSIFSFIYNENAPIEILQQYFNNDHLAFAEAVSLLMSYSLINHTALDKNILYSTHEMIQSVVLQFLNKDECKHCIQNIINSFNAIIPEQLNEFMHSCANRFYFLMHLDAIIKQAMKYKIYSNDLIELYLRKLKFYLPEKRDSKMSQEAISEISEIVGKVKRIKNLTLARFHLRKVNFYAWRAGDSDKSLDQLKVAEQYLKFCDTAYEEQLMLYSKFVQTLVLRGELDHALQYSDLAKGLIAKVNLSLDNQSIFYIARDRARIFEDKGDMQTAYDNIEISIKKAREIEKIDGMGIAAVTPVLKARTTISIIPLMIKARILTKLGKCDQSYSVLNMVRKKIYKATGRAHVTSLGAELEAEIARCLLCKHKLIEAAKHIRKSLNSFETLYPDIQKSIKPYASAYVILGDINALNKGYRKAQKAYLQAEEIYKKLLQNFKIDDVSYLYTQLAINSARLKDTEATYQYLDTHKRLFDKSHKRTFEITNYLQEYNLPF